MSQRFAKFVVDGLIDFHSEDGDATIFSRPSTRPMTLPSARIKCWSDSCRSASSSCAWDSKNSRHFVLHLLQIG